MKKISFKLIYHKKNICQVIVVKYKKYVLTAFLSVVSNDCCGGMEGHASVI